MHRFLALALLMHLAPLAPALASPAATITASPLTWERYVKGTGASYVYGPLAADFTGDGSVELAWADSYSWRKNAFRDDSAIIYLAKPGEAPVEVYRDDFSWHPNHANWNGGHMLIERMIALDTNADGWLDIVAVANTGDAVRAYENPGYDTAGAPLGAWTARTLTLSTPGAVNLTDADPDGDGDRDIVVTMRAQGDVWPAAKPGLGILWNDGAGGWTYEDISVNQAGFTDPRTLVAMDIYLDGRDEIIMGDRLSGIVRAFRRVGTGWQVHQLTTVDASGLFYGAACVVNGELQFVFAKSNGLWAANVRHTVGAPPLTQIAQYSGTAITTEIGCADLDADGKQEIITATRDNGLFWFDQVGSTWRWHFVTRRIAAHETMTIADVGGDTRPDIITGVEYPGAAGGAYGSDMANGLMLFVTGTP